MADKLKIPTGGAAAALVGIITTLIIFYIVFLPPEARQQILKNDFFENKTLIDEVPGTISFGFVGEREHTVPNLALIESVSAVVLSKINPFIVSKGWFSEKVKTHSFSVGQPENLDNVLLSFSSPSHKGVLTIVLNDNLVFEGELFSDTPPPVELPKSLLRRQNVLEFRVVRGFWKKSVSVSEVKIIADVADVASQIASNTLSVPSEEFAGVETASLSFVPNCQQEKIGKLEIMFNGRLVSSAVPVCDSLNRLELFKEDFVEGRNTLVMKLLKGRADVEQIKLKTKSGALSSTLYSFGLSREQYSAIRDGRARVDLEMVFPESTSLKQIDVSVNGVSFGVNQRTSIFVRDISSLVREGNNVVQLLPRRAVSIVRFDVRIT